MKLFYSAMLCFLVGLLFVPIGVSFAQNTDKQAIIDSLTNELSRAKEDTNKVNLLVRLNNELFNTSSFDQIFKNASQILALSKKLKFASGIMQGYNGMGASNFHKGEYEEASKYYLEALKIAEQENDLAGTGQLYNNLAGIYMVSDEMERAAIYFEKSYAIFEKLGKEVNIMQASYNLGFIYTSIGKYDKAFEYLQKSLALITKFNHIQGRIMALNSLGILYEKQKNYQKALVTYREALLYADNIKDDYHSTQVLNNIGYVMYKFLNKNDSAEYFVKKSVEVGKKINHKEALKNSYAYLSDIYKAKKNYDEAFKYVDLLVAMKDSLLNEKKVEAIANLEKKYETEKKEAQLKISEQGKQLAQASADRNFWSLIVASFFLLVAIGFAFLFFKYNAVNKKLKEVASHRTVNDFKGLFGNLKDDNGQVLPQYQDVAGKLLAIATTQERLAKSTKADDYISITEEIPDFMQNVKDVMGAKNLAIQTDIGKFALRLNKSNALLYLIDELVRNAIKHAFANTTQPEVSLSLHQENGALHLIFKDNGSGLPEGKKPAIIHELVENFNGMVKVSNENGTVYDMVLKANLKG